VKKIVFCLLALPLLAQAPWEYDPETAQELKQKIRAIHRESFRRFYADSEYAYLNFSSKECSGCKNRDFGLPIEESLRQAGFTWKEPLFKSEGHCGGITLLFIKHLLNHPPSSNDSCKNILIDFQNKTYLQSEAHALHMHQLPGYVPFKEIQENPELGKLFFSTLIGAAAKSFFILPPSEKGKEPKFEAISIYTTLKNLSGQILFVDYYNVNTKSGHVVAIYSHPEKPLFFDSNLGLFKFDNLESLSQHLEQYLQNCSLSYMVTFQ
jgi:hypothetical protein